MELWALLPIGLFIGGFVGYGIGFMHGCSRTAQTFKDMINSMQTMKRGK